MNDLQSLDQQIRQRLKSVEEEERSEQIKLQAKMVDLEKRHTKFDKLADELMKTIINPRMEKLASFFDNAQLLDPNEIGMHYCVCRFNHSFRYPASVKLSLSVTHDAEIENLLLVYDLDILPVFFKFKSHVQTALSIENPNKEEITNWIDEQILLFVDTYLRLEQTDQYQQNSLVTDPVCGMRFRKSIATAETKQSGHTYFFCSSDCYEKFNANPERYVQ